MESGEYIPKLLREMLRETPLLLDGAWGTEIAKRHPELAALPALVSVRQPSLLEDVGRDYLRAGAMALTVNSFRASPWLMEQADEDFARVNLQAVAMLAALRPAAMLGSMAPLRQEARVAGVRHADDASWQSEQFERQASALLKAGCRTALLETFGDLDEILLAMRSCRAAGLEEVYCSCHAVFRHGAPRMPGSEETLAFGLARLMESGADLIGINCVNGPDEALRMLQSLPAKLTDQPFGVRPNAGSPVNADGGLTHPIGAEAFGASAARLWDAGASLIGGCCGTSPGHIAALAKVLKR